MQRNAGTMPNSADLRLGCTTLVQQPVGTPNLRCRLPPSHVMTHHAGALCMVAVPKSHRFGDQRPGRNSDWRSLRNRAPSGVGFQRSWSAVKRPRRSASRIGASITDGGRPVRSLEPAGGHPSQQSHRIEHELERQLVARHFDILCDELECPGAAQITRRAAIARLPQDAIRKRDLRVGTGANAQIVAETPVVEVVSALIAGLRVGRHFVMLVAGRCQCAPRSTSCIDAASSSSGSAGGCLANTVFASIVS